MFYVAIRLTKFKVRISYAIMESLCVRLPQLQRRDSTYIYKTLTGFMVRIGEATLWFGWIQEFVCMSR